MVNCTCKQDAATRNRRFNVRIIKIIHWESALSLALEIHPEGKNADTEMPACRVLGSAMGKIAVFISVLSLV